MSDRSASRRGSSHSSDRSVRSDVPRRKSNNTLSSRSHSRSSSRSRSGSDDSRTSNRYERSGSHGSQSYSSSRYNRRRIGAGVGGKNTGVERPTKITRRVLSAGRLKVNELRNKVAELSGMVNQLKDENRLMRRQQIRQEKKLGQYESIENDMPTLLQRQNGEMNMLREQLRKQKEKLTTKEKKLHKTEEDLERSSRLLKKMSSLVDDKKLGEREELANKLKKSNETLTKRDDDIKRLERYIENLNKNHKHEFGIEHARQKEANRIVEQLKSEIEKLQFQLKEREKELNMKGMYVQRLVNVGGGASSSGSASRPPHHLQRDSSSPHPNLEPNTDLGLQQQQQQQQQGSNSSGAAVVSGAKRRGRLTQNQRQQQQQLQAETSENTSSLLGQKLSSADSQQQKQQKQQPQQKKINGRSPNTAAADIPPAPTRKPPVKPAAADKSRQIAAQQKRQLNDTSAATRSTLDQDLQQEQDIERRSRDEENAKQKAKEERERKEKLEKEDRVMKEIEEKKRLEAEEVRKFELSLEGQENRKVKDSLIEKLNNLSTNNDDDNNSTNRSQAVNSQRGGRNNTGAGFGAYKPSALGGPSSSSGQASQSIMDELFGNDAEKKENRSSPSLFDNAGFLEAGDGNNRFLPRRKREPAATLAELSRSRSGSDEIMDDF